MNTHPDTLSFLKSCLPKEAFEIIFTWIKQYDVQIICSKPRASKLGDYRSPSINHGHRITINKNLNQYSLIITLTHEIAHLKTWMTYNRSAKPHGPEWKREFQNLMLEFTPFKLFPPKVETALANYLTNPKASSCNDYHLSKSLLPFDYFSTPLCTLESMPEKDLFQTSSGKIFKKGIKLRKRYKCLELNSGKYYLFNPLAMVSAFKPE